jgi:hypothetical protein
MLAIADHVVQPSKQTLRLVGKNPLHIYRKDWFDQQRSRGIRTPWSTSMWDDIKRDFNALTAEQRRQLDERSARDKTVARQNRAVAVLMLKGVAKGKAKVARTLQRLPEGDRKDSIWKPEPAGETLEEARANPLPPRVSAVPGAPGRVSLRRGVELRKYGCTGGSLGCVMAQAGTASSRPHSEQCRNRIVELMKGDRDGAVRVEESDRRRQKTTDVKKEQVLYALMWMDTGGASSSSAGPVAASTPMSSAAAGPTLDAEMGDSVDIDAF